MLIIVWGNKATGVLDLRGPATFNSIAGRPLAYSADVEAVWTIGYEVALGLGLDTSDVETIKDDRIPPAPATTWRRGLPYRPAQGTQVMVDTLRYALAAKSRPQHQQVSMRAKEMSAAIAAGIITWSDCWALTPHGEAIWDQLMVMDAMRERGDMINVELPLP